MTTEMVKYAGRNGDQIDAYYARPADPGRVPGVVVIHHLPGWDEWTCEVVRKLAHHGYAAVAPHLYSRSGLSPDEAAAQARPTLGVSDDQAMGDIEGSMRFLRSQGNANGRVGCIGFCSGGRQAFLAACRVPNLDAAVDCWGGGVVPHERWPLDATLRPVWPIDLSEQMKTPLLGIFGNDDQFPTPANVDDTEAVLKRLGKDYEFHRYDGAGHGFFSTDRANSRPEQAKDAWEKVFAFYKKHLTAPVPAGTR
jgi:carboxymethylenebutenolidase